MSIFLTHVYWLLHINYIITTTDTGIQHTSALCTADERRPNIPPEELEQLEGNDVLVPAIASTPGLKPEQSTKPNDPDRTPCSESNSQAVHLILSRT